MTHAGYNSNRKSHDGVLAPFWNRCVALATIIFVLSIAQDTLAQYSPREAKIRTGYIHNFTKYVTWPNSAFAHANAPFIIAVYGSSDLDPYLKLLAKHRKVGNRRIQFKQIADLESCGKCHLLYVQAELSEEEGRRLSAALKGTHVLAVGEGSQFLNQGGSIRFMVRNNLLNLELSVGTAELRKHSVRSQLLRLDVVHRVK